MRDRLKGIIDKWEKTEGLSDYLIENGIVCPPCKVGDMVYMTTPISVIERKAVGFRYSTDMTKLESILIDLVTDKEGNTNTFYFNADKINQSIFFTREEAEKALRGEGE